MRTIPLLLLLAGCTGITSEGTPSVPTGEEISIPRPNVVFLIADDQRSDMLSCMGNRYLQTPVCDRLAREGVRFTSAFVTSAVCSPSRGSFLTGKHVHQCGTQPIIHMNHTFHRNERPFPALLHDAGYHTAHFGKWHLGEGDRKKPGYDHWAGYYALIPFFDPLLTINGEQQRFEGFADHVIADLAAEHIRSVAKEDQPFCVYVAFGAPHYDFSFPEHLEGVLDGIEIVGPPSIDEDVTRSGKPPCIQNSPLRFDRLIQSKAHDGATVGTLDHMTRRYLRSSLSLDESVGRVMRALDEAGVTEDTIVVYTSDHGHMLGEHGLAAKHLAYEESIRVPLLLRYPRRVPAGLVRDELAANIDVMPTLLELCGVPVPDDVAGRSLRPLLEAGRAPAADWRDDFAFLHETCVAVRTSRHKLIRYPDGVQRELYDLDRDPYEITNRIDDPAYASIQREMEQRLERHLRETDFPQARNEMVSRPWLLGPFTAAEERAVVEAALASPLGDGAITVGAVSAGAVAAGGKEYRWRRPEARGGGLPAEYLEARWMWAPGGNPADRAPVGQAFFRRVLTIPDDARIASARVLVAVDNHYTLHVNGEAVARGTGWHEVGAHDITPRLVPGENVIAFVGENAGKDPNPAGLLAGVRVELLEGEPLALSSGALWRVTDHEEEGWTAPGFDDSAWPMAQDLGRRTMLPWQTGIEDKIRPSALLGGEPDERFLLAFEIEQLCDRDPFVRLHFQPARNAVVGWANGERLFERDAGGNPFNHIFNPPLRKGGNTLLFRGRLGDYPWLNIRVQGWEGKTRLRE
jgi:N-acetylglucosamine-6-sulfatase